MKEDQKSVIPGFKDRFRFEIEIKKRKLNRDK